MLGPKGGKHSEVKLQGSAVWDLLGEPDKRMMNNNARVTNATAGVGPSARKLQRSKSFLHQGHPPSLQEQGRHS